jgi:hypothetical protein
MWRRSRANEAYSDVRGLVCAADEGKKSNMNHKCIWLLFAPFQSVGNQNSRPTLIVLNIFCIDVFIDLTMASQS